MSIGHSIVRLFKSATESPPVIADVEKPSGPKRSLHDWRNGILNSRQEIIGKDGIFSDRSPTGAGKSAGDIQAVQHVERALIIAPTHENCLEIENDMQAANVNAMKYPGRVTRGEHQNCSNGIQADAAESMGFNVVGAVCSGCSWRAECIKFGYLHDVAKVKDADVAIATQGRAIRNGLAELASGRTDYIVCHEDSASVIRPQEDISVADLQTVQSVLNTTLSDPILLNWLGATASRDDDGILVENQKLAERREKIDSFVRHLADTVDFVLAAVIAAEKTKAIALPATIKKAPGTESFLFRVCCEMEVKFSSAAWRLLIAAAAGEVADVGVIIDNSQNLTKHDQNSAERRRFSGVWRNIPAKDSTFLVCDATATLEELQDYTGRPVVDITPIGHLQNAKRAVQFPRDITRRTSASRFLAVLRGILTSFASHSKIGVITHRTLVGYLPKIGDAFSQRIAKSTYFGSGQDRASNDWYSECDLIIVAGTPRLRSMAIQQRLVQFGDYKSAGELPDWGEIRWRGTTESGKEQIVKNIGYRHPAWNRAQRSLVRAAIIQAAGRSRSLLDDGCEVVVLTTEECGFVLADENNEPMADGEINVLSALWELSEQNLTTDQLSELFAKNIYKGKVPIDMGLSTFVPLTGLVTSSDIAKSLSLSDRRIRTVLGDLESRLLVSRDGIRGGWLLTEAGRQIARPSVNSPSAAQQGGQPA